LLTSTFLDPLLRGSGTVTGEACKGLCCYVMERKGERKNR
jgi:hypothetical protein